MLETTIILLVGSACGFFGTDFQTPSEVNGYYVMCARETYLEHAQQKWGFIEDYGFNVLYVVNYYPTHPQSHELVGGYANYRSNYAVSNAFIGNMVHEIKHLECDCDWHEDMRFEDQITYIKQFLH